MSLNKVPLSPHLQVYRLPLVALVSISSRICFVANSVTYALFIIFLIFLNLFIFGRDTTLARRGTPLAFRAAERASGVAVLKAITAVAP